MAKMPDLYELLAAQAKADAPATMPSYLRQYTSPELRERKEAPRTHADPTARKAVNNAEPKRKRRRRRHL